MKKNLIFMMLILFLLSACSTGNVAVTQTGNPVSVTVGYQVKDSIRNSLPPAMARASASVDMVNDLTIISAKIVVHEIRLLGNDGAVHFKKIPPYVLDVIQPTNTTIPLDTSAGPAGTSYDAISLSIESYENTSGAVLLNEESIEVVGYTNGNPAESFTFVADEDFEVITPLGTPVTLSETEPNHVRVVLDVQNWFKYDDGSWINPHDTLNANVIEESILESISGDEEYDDIDESNLIDDDDD